MNAQLIKQAVDIVGKSLKSLGEHFKTHHTEYLVGGGAAAVAGGVAYAEGHDKGKKEGTIEQAARDEKKMADMQNKHEEDRSKCSQEKQAYEDLLDEVENK